jgi:hypothetical protein
MAGTTIVPIVLTEGNKGIEKLLSPKPPHQGRGGHFVWQIRSDLTEDVEVDLIDFAPAGYVKIVSQHPTTAPAGGVALVQADVINAQAGKETKVTYGVSVDGKSIDPDLIIDGDPTPRVASPQKQSGAKKKGGKKR